MISKILPFLNQLIPAGLATKGLSKINPRIGSYIADATAAGYSVNQILDFLRSQTSPQKDESLRPDQMAAESRISQGNLPVEALKTGASTVAGAGAISAVPSILGGILEGGQSQQETPNQQNIIEQYSPELFQFISDLIGKGRSPLEAGALAQLDKRFMKVIKSMETDHKTPFSSILQSVFGSTQQNKQQQGADTDQALMAALQKILQM